MSRVLLLQIKNIFEMHTHCVPVHIKYAVCTNIPCILCKMRVDLEFFGNLESKNFQITAFYVIYVTPPAPLTPEHAHVGQILGL